MWRIIKVWHTSLFRLHKNTSIEKKFSIEASLVQNIPSETMPVKE